MNNDVDVAVSLPPANDQDGRIGGERVLVDVSENTDAAGVWARLPLDLAVSALELSAGTIKYQDTGGEGPVLVLLHVCSWTPRCGTA